MQVEWERVPSIGCAVTATVGAIATLALAVWLLDIPRRLTGEVKRIDPKAVPVLHEFSAFQSLVHRYSADNVIPPPTLAEAIQEQGEPGMRLLRSGIDPWGRPFIYRVRTIQQESGSVDFIVTLRSVGPNGRDEGGKGDDVEAVTYGCALPRRQSEEKVTE